MPVIEASSGSTAVSEAYFAKMLGLPFLAVVPHSTAAEKIAAIEFQGGRCHFVDNAMELYATASALAAEMGGHYMDQFTYAERATDWRGNNNIAEIDLRPVVARAAPGARLDCLRGRYGRHVGHYRALHTLQSPAYKSLRRGP